MRTKDGLGWLGAGVVEEVNDGAGGLGTRCVEGNVCVLGCDWDRDICWGVRGGYGDVEGDGVSGGVAGKCNAWVVGVDFRGGAGGVQ